MDTFHSAIRPLALALAFCALPLFADDTAAEPAAKTVAVSPEEKYKGMGKDELREALDAVSNEVVDLARGLGETKKEIERAVRDPEVTSPSIAPIRAEVAAAEAALAAARDKLRAAVCALPEYKEKAAEAEAGSAKLDRLRAERDYLRKALRGRAEVVGSRPAD